MDISNIAETPMKKNIDLQPPPLARIGLIKGSVRMVLVGKNVKSFILAYVIVTEGTETVQSMAALRVITVTIFIQTFVLTH